MCRCTPELRTPFCGRGDCQWPRLATVCCGARPIDCTDANDPLTADPQSPVTWWRECLKCGRRNPELRELAPGEEYATP